jgi:hypothetical protein
MNEMNYMSGPLSSLPRIIFSKTKRISSYDRTGGNRDYITIKSMEKVNIAEIKGAGIIRHIWITANSENRYYLRDTILRMFWDGEENPSVEVPLGDFFGVGHGVANHFVSLPLSMIRGPGRGLNAGMNCYFPMPFSKEARIEIENESNIEIRSFYFHVDYEEWESIPENYGRFHAWWNRENPCKAIEYEGEELNTTGDENYLILYAEGVGHYVGCVLSVDNFNAFHQNYTWFGEGDDMIFVDGEKWPPSIHGTGTEDYFLSAWGFPSGEYSGPYHGVSLAGDVNEWSGKWSMYRFHIEDPIRFTKSIKVTIEHGHANDQGNDYSSVAYWYQKEPHKKFPPLPKAKDRRPKRM